jgi:hypothetical protein
VKFTLTYEGPLPSSGNKAKNQEKWQIRKVLHPQFIDLWKSHPALIEIENNRHFPIVGGATLTQVHHLHPGPVHPPVQAPMIGNYQVLDLGTASVAGRNPRDFLDLCGSIEKHGAWFRPLVRETFALHCGLKILFLRREPPGKIYQGGDLDGRMKTLLDALTMPQHAEQILERHTTECLPLHCLLEDDSMISGLEIESERLLGDNQKTADFVKLTIEVDVRIKRPMIYNQSFIG